MTSNLEVEIQFTQEAPLLCCKYSHDKQYVITGSANGKILVYDRKAGRLGKELADGGMNNPVTSLNTNGLHLLATYAGGQVKEWDLRSGLCTRTINEPRQCLGVQHHPQEPKFITYGSDGEIWMYDEESGCLERKFAPSLNPEKVDGHKGRVFAAKFHPVSRSEFITGGWDNTVQFWDIRKQYSFRNFSGPHICGEGLDIHRSGEKILTCAFQSENQLTLWDYGSGTPISEISNIKGKLYCGKWIAPMFIATGSSQPCLVKVLCMANKSDAFTYKLPHHLGVYGMDSFDRPSPTGRRKDKVLDCKLGFVSNDTFTEMQLNYIFD